MHATDELRSRLRNLREACGFSLHEVSRRSYRLSQIPEGRISPGQLLFIERGTTKRPGYLKLVTLAGIYGVGADALTKFLESTSRKPSIAAAEYQVKTDPPEEGPS